MAATSRTVVTNDRSQQTQTSLFARHLLAGLGPLFVLYGFYSILRYLVADRGPSLGLTNAIKIIDFERTLGIYHETGIQEASLPHDWFIQFSNWYYVLGFLPMLVGGAVLAAWKAPAALFHWRGIFALSMLIAIIGYIYFPLSPPRLLPPEWGFVDTLTTYGPQYYGDHSGASLFNAYGRLPNMVNVYAAMPSMHVAWSVIASALIIASFPQRIWAKITAVLHPVIMGIAVIVTANHFLLDVVAGLLVLGLAVMCVRAYDRRFGGEPEHERYTGSFPPAASGAG